MLVRRVLLSVVLGCIVASRAAGSQDAKPASLQFRLPAREGPIRVEAFDIRSGSAIADLENRTEREVEGGFILFAIEGGCDPSLAYVVHTATGIAFPNAARCEETAEVEVLPARGFVLAVAAEGVHDAVRVDLLECTSPASNGALVGRIRIPLENGRGVIRLPERCVQPQVFASGYAPKRLGNLDVANLTSGVELLATLRKGASIAVQVVAGAEQTPVPAVDAAIDDGSGSPEARATANDVFQRAQLHGKSDPAGWIFIDGIMPGRIHVHVKSSEGIARAGDDYAVEGGVETVMDALHLAQPARLSLRILIDRALLDEGLTLLGGLLTSVSVPSHGTIRHQAKVNEDLVATFPPVLPGKWRVDVVGRLSGTTAMALVGEEVTLDAGADTLVELKVSHRIYHGKVVGLRRPIRSGLLILRPIRVDDPSFTLNLDSTARFHVPLLHPAEYNAILQIDGQAQAVTIPSIRLDDPSKEVEVRLPSATIRGQVVDENGRPLVGAKVRAEISVPASASGGTPESSESSTDSEGRFEFSYGTAGTWTIDAENGESASDRVVLKIGEADEVSGVLLRTTPKIPIEGVVVNANGSPIPQTAVTLWPVPAGGGDLPAPQIATSDGAGRFRFTVSKAWRQGDFVVETRDGGVAATRALLAAGAQVTIRLPALSGVLRVRRQGDLPWPGLAVTLQRLIGPDGAQIPIHSVGRFSSPVERVVGKLAPGTWIFAEATTPDEMSRLAHGVLTGLRVSRFEIVAGRENSVQVATH